MIPRTRHIEALKELMDSSSERFFSVYGEEAAWVSDFIHSLKSSGVFHGEHVEAISHIDIEWYRWPKSDTEYLIITGNIQDISYFRSIIEPKLHENIKWVVYHGSKDDGSMNYLLPSLSFREYAEYRGKSIDIWQIMSGNIQVDELNTLKDEYIKTGWYPSHIAHDHHIFGDFDKKRSIMKQELFEKEYEEFEEYMRALAMNTGNLFKSDGLAKVLGISRRKVNKYTEILMTHGIIVALWPWWDHSDTETTRHVKIYFRELYYLRAILGDIHYQWQMKQWAIENFILLELMKKLGESHDFAFYRKKSWAEITFIITDHENTLITPIEVSLRDSDVISQAIKTFDRDYHGRVERYMIWNNSRVGKESLDEVPVMILPHIAI